MKVEALHIGQKVRHPQHGIGIVKALTEQSADIQFDDLKRTISPQTSDIQPAEGQATINGLEFPLARFVDEIVPGSIDTLGLAKPDSVVDELPNRWRGG